METYELYAMASVGLFTIGLAAVFLCRHFFKKIIATKIIGAGVFLLLVSIAERDAELFADPVPHAMVITGIVVAVSAAAFALALARRIRLQSGRSEFGGSEE
jgi:multicomponent Na+:H+ antiporter subunit C